MLPHVISLASKMGSAVTTFQAIDPPHEVYAAPVMIEIQQNADRYVCGIADRFKEQGGIGDCTTEVTLGRPAQNIVDYAEKHNVDLIAMASHGRSGVSQGAITRHQAGPQVVRVNFPRSTGFSRILAGEGW